MKKPWMKRIRTFCMALALCVTLCPKAAAVPAIPDGQNCYHRTVRLVEGDSVSLPAGNNDELCWFCDGDAARVSSDGTCTAVRPGVALAVAQSLGETVVFTVRVDAAQEETFSEDEEIPAPAEGAWSDLEGDTPYCIAVNRLANVVTVYTRDEDGRYTMPVKVMLCSTGDDTPYGEFEVGAKIDWLSLFGDVYGQYISVIDGNILFHSVPYTQPKKDTLKWDYFNLLGTKCSMGCIRLEVANTLWIYENCEEGTPILIYDDEDPGPLGKPEAKMLGAGCSWDPTDPDPANPWLTGTPYLTAPARVTVEAYTKPKLMAGVTAVDSGGGDWREFVTVAGEVDTSRNGEYTVTYSMTDAAGRSASAKTVFTVVGA